ncbi:hypothetical protein [Vibrio fluvialis]|uniref:hypothetical protein n=1 Tax=Vibrio fluvialis TaxID=676 RepID=UPI001C9C3965|nr:hypothetical protein [Vibrio fluvialis]ELL4670047.1 hypothetical protein [Vibrio fluvialis]ELO1779819.1 hypothetical protein [Vibrio fluvialis]MBY8220833.1 hypothetical protein [Vibrio fluvialis]MBY8286153.1 hypothetical protein [Vibrio fluvialis]MCE7648253.1 hypothetical protein [Vibrio fluvialis]
MSTHSFSLIDGFGHEVVKVNEVTNIPRDAYKIDSGTNVEKSITHLVSDMVKGAISVPNKTLELVFSPEVQKGLDLGTYQMMVPKSGLGDTFADVVDESGQIVGKGRLIEGGKVRQLASGAFQLVSIAVAQSHLADINDSLSKLNDAVESIINHLDNDDKSKISGALEYLKGIAEDIAQYKSAEALSAQKRVIIESIIKDSHTWVNKSLRDFENVIAAIEKQEDIDRFGGTEDTYNKLKWHSNRIKSIYEKREILSELHKLLYLILMYIDPSLKDYSRPNLKVEKWQSLISKYRQILLRKNEELLTKAFWNADSTLKMRKENIEFHTNKSSDLLLKQDSIHSQSIATLNNDLLRIFNDNELRVALTFDSHGEVEQTAFV